MKNSVKKVVIFIFSFFVFASNIFGYNEAPVDITQMNVYELQDAVDKGYLTYELITKLYLDRIEAYDKNYKAVININKKAIEEAIEKDKEYKESGRTSILFGMPVVVKDNIDVKGLPTTAGAKTLANSYPNEDAKIIKNLKELGMVVLAKTNMSEFAFSANSSVSSYGTVRNAYNTNYSSYGSSGGTAVAIALQYAPFGIGTDTNSSLRAPASANNIIGFRPTLSLLSSDGILPYDMTRDTAGAMTKNVLENALLLEALAGLEEGAYSADLDKNSISEMKIGVIDQFLYGDSSIAVYGTGATYSKLKTAIDKKLKLLEENGTEVVHIKDFYSTRWSNLDDNTVAGWTMCYGFNKYIKGTNSIVKNFYQLSNSSGHISALGGYTQSCSKNISSIDNLSSKKAPYKEHVENTFKKHKFDVLVYPTTKNELSKIGNSGNFESPAFAIAPSLGLPAVSVPLGLIDNLPYGLDVVGLKNSEAKIYEFIYGLENLSDTYVLPDAAKALYEVPEAVKNLMEFYEDNREIKSKYIFETKKVKNYRDAYDRVVSFFENYNEYEDKEKTATELYNAYEDAIKSVGNHDIKIFIAIGIVTSICGIIVVLIAATARAKSKRRGRRM